MFSKNGMCAGGNKFNDNNESNKESKHDTEKSVRPFRARREKELRRIILRLAFIHKFLLRELRRRYEM